jgi:peptidoglycan/LPS O-acetylase OafA/YrhL
VMLEHSYFLIDNRVERDPLNVLSKGQTNSGALAVAMFFSISGFLVTMSAIRGRSIPDYLLRRLARIAPGFWVASVVGFAIVGPLAATNLSNFFSDQNWKSLIAHALMLRQANPGATLESNPISLVHGTLWTIKLEFDCYLIIAALALLLTSRFVPYVYAGIAAILGLSIVFATHLPQINYGVLSLVISSPSDWPGLFPFFFVGSAFYTFRHPAVSQPFVPLQSRSHFLLAGRGGSCCSVGHISAFSSRYRRLPPFEFLMLAWIFLMASTCTAGRFSNSCCIISG